MSNNELNGKKARAQHGSHTSTAVVLVPSISGSEDGPATDPFVDLALSGQSEIPGRGFNKVLRTARDLVVNPRAHKLSETADE